MITVIKDGIKSQMTKMAWDLLGTNKEGFEIVRDVPKDVSNRMNDLNEEPKGEDIPGDKPQSEDLPQGEPQTDATPGPQSEDVPQDSEEEPKSEDASDLKAWTKEQCEIALKKQEDEQYNEALSILEEVKSKQLKNNPYINRLISDVKAKING